MKESGYSKNRKNLVMYRKNNYSYVDSAVETENDRLQDELRDKVKSLKDVTIRIGDEVRSQNQFLNGMDTDMDNAGGFLGKAMGRVKLLSKGSHNYVILYLLGFSIFVFFILWILIKFYG